MRTASISAALAGSFFLLLASRANACDDTLGAGHPHVQQLIIEGAIAVPDAHHNVGLYEWNGELEQPVLVQSWTDPELFTTAIPEESGDFVEVLPEVVPGGEEYLGCNQPRTLPPVVVTTSLPNRGNFGRFVRFISFSAGGGRRAINRPVMAFKPIQAETNLTCSSSQDDRNLSAVTAIRSGIPLFARFGFFRVTFAPGNVQFFSCTQPLFSNCGITPVGECGANPSTPSGTR